MINITILKKILRYVVNGENIRGTLYFVLNYYLFRSIKFPLKLYPNVYINNKRKIRFGKNTLIFYGAFINPTDLEIGDNVGIGVNCFLCGKVRMGDNVMIGPNVSIPGANHNFDLLNIPMVEQGNTIIGTTIEDNVWVGANCTILDGVTIGSGSIIAAGSVVTKNVADNSIMAGVPARLIKTRA